MTKRIGILGAGTAGLHLGLLLRQQGVDATIITDRKGEDYRASRLQNTVAHHSITIAREENLGVNHWPVNEYGYFCHYHNFGGEHPLYFRGDFASPSRAVDYRVYLPALMNDFEQRGGRIEYRHVAEEEIQRLCMQFDLLVVCTGKTALGRLFEQDPDFPALDRPFRYLCAGLYTGISSTAPRAVTFSVSPGHGEMIEIPTLSFGGMVTALLFENIAGGDLEELAHLPYAENPRAFRETVLNKLRLHHTATYKRVNHQEFDLCGPNDLLQGAITPTVRRGYCELTGGKFAIALGDFHVTVDPVVGQGANLASHAAWVLGEAIVREERFDLAFCERVDRARRERILGAFRWTNFMLQPPSPEFLRLVLAMSQNRALCDEFTDNFNYPERQWRRLESPASIRAWLEERGSNTGTAAGR